MGLIVNDETTITCHLFNNYLIKVIDNKCYLISGLRTKKHILSLLNESLSSFSYCNSLEETSFTFSFIFVSLLNFYFIFFLLSFMSLGFFLFNFYFLRNKSLIVAFSDGDLRVYVFVCLRIEC